jgi:hypothetical protein
MPEGKDSPGACKRRSQDCASLVIKPLGPARTTVRPAPIRQYMVRARSGPLLGTRTRVEPVPNCCEGESRAMTDFLQADLGALQLRFPIDQDRATLGPWLRIDPTDPALIDPDFFWVQGNLAS